VAPGVSPGSYGNADTGRKCFYALAVL